MVWNRSSPIKSMSYKGGVINSICHDIKTVLLNPDVFNPIKNSLGTIGFGLTKFDCTTHIDRKY